METKYSSFPPYYEKPPANYKKYDTLNLCTMGEMKSSRFPHSTEFRYKKKHAQLLTKDLFFNVVMFYFCLLQTYEESSKF